MCYPCQGFEEHARREGFKTLTLNNYKCLDEISLSTGTVMTNANKYKCLPSYSAMFCSSNLAVCEERLVKSNSKMEK